MFCCNIGKNGYEISEEDPELQLRKGPIFLNVLLNNLKANLTLHDIAVGMKQDIHRIKNARPHFEKLSNLILFSTLDNYILSDRANKNSEFEETVLNLYISPSNEYQSFNWQDERVLTYRFIPDTFINSVILEINTITKRFCKYAVTYQSLIFIDQIESPKTNQSLFRIRNFLAAKRFNLSIPIMLEVTMGSVSSSFEIKLPEVIYHIFDRMNTSEIDAMIEEKNKFDINDEISVSSYDVENESFEVTSNDELTN